MFKKILKSILVFIAFIVILIEDVLWDYLLKVTKKLDEYKIVQKIELWMSGLSPYNALTLFIVPDLFIIPLKLALVKMMASGMIIEGIVLLIIAKIFATALYAKIFIVCKPALLQISWVKWIHDKIKSFKDKWYDKIKHTETYQNLIEFKNKIKLKILEIKEIFRSEPGRFSRIKEFLRKKKESV